MWNDLTSRESKLGEIPADLQILNCIVRCFESEINYFDFSSE
jgi:hypothetical protein